LTLFPAALGAESKGISFESQQLTSIGLDFVFVELTRQNARNEDFPHAAGWMPAHRMAAPVH